MAVSSASQCSPVAEQPETLLRAVFDSLRPRDTNMRRLVLHLPLFSWLDRGAFGGLLVAS